MRVNRRTFIAGASAAVGAAATAGWSAGSASARGFSPAADPRQLARLRELPSVRAAERAFGPADWSALQRGSLSAVSSYGDAVFCVPLKSSDGTPTVLALSDPAASEGRAALRAAAARRDDGALFNDDVVVQARRERVDALRWSTVDGRHLASWEVEADRRLALGSDAVELADALGGSALVFAARLQPRGEDVGSDAAALLAAGARGKAAVRSSGVPLVSQAA